MKKIIAFILVSLMVFSCKLNDQNEVVGKIPSKSTTAKDSTLVNEKDENGCLASAGYVWSKVNKECVKGFSGIQLNPIDKPANEDETLSAYVLFNEDTSKAEIFLPKDTTSIVLSRTGQGKSWMLNDWQLLASKGYLLKKSNKTLFSGDEEIGKKVTGSDTEEQ
ncbi:hypothetical protein [Flavobacterium sp.]|uniref:hypothetical protein n=1 Tax=Flavobacterium sp. TaxID=239 RepID=UPI0025F8024B|nr:hypothetical protein [Flavobacterium sp.]